MDLYINPYYNNREYNQLSSLTRSIVTKSGQDQYSLREQFDQIKGNTIVGVRITRQSHNSEAPKKDCDGVNILNEEALGGAHWTLWNCHNDKVIDQDRLEPYTYDTYEHNVGTFAQILIDKIDLSQSFIKFGDVNDVKNDEAIEITFIYLQDCVNGVAIAEKK